MRGPRFLARSWGARVAVTGHSMVPTLRPGDWLLVDPDAFGPRGPMVGDLVVARDPRWQARLIVKRVASVGPDGGVVLCGDAPDASTDSRVFGAVAPDDLLGRPWFRYWPPRAVGRVR